MNGKKYITRIIEVYHFPHRRIKLTIHIHLVLDQRSLRENEYIDTVH